MGIYDNGYGYGTNNNNQKPKSKYLRDPSVKTSKYLRDKNDKPRSKYARDKNEKREHHYNLARNYREEEEIIENLTEDELEEAQTAENEAIVEEDNEIASVEATTEIKNEESSAETDIIESEDTSENIEISQVDELESVEDYQNRIKGDNKESYSEETANLFSHSKLSRETTVAHVEDAEEARRKVIIMTIVTLVVLTVAACLMQFATIKTPYMPSMLNIDFSAFPELIASLAYGPVFGILIIIVKNIVRLFTANVVSYGSILSNAVLDSVFVVIGGLFYSRRMYAVNSKINNKPTNKDLRKRRIVLGGLIATIVTTVVSFFLTNYVSYPLIVKQFSSRGIDNSVLLQQYQDAIDLLNAYHPELFSTTVTKFDSLQQAILFYNIPLTLIKFLLIAIATAIVYPLISPYIHFRKKTK